MNMWQQIVAADEARNLTGALPGTITGPDAVAFLLVVVVIVIAGSRSERL